MKPKHATLSGFEFQFSLNGISTALLLHQSLIIFFFSKFLNREGGLYLVKPVQHQNYVKLLNFLFRFSIAIKSFELSFYSRDEFTMKHLSSFCTSIFLLELLTNRNSIVSSSVKFHIQSTEHFRLITPPAIQISIE